MKVGSLVYATDQGLGILAKAFYDHGIVTHPCIVRHGRHITHDDWYPGAPQIAELRSRGTMEIVTDLIRSVDVMLFFETPFIWELVPLCRERGVKTIIMPMHECMPVSQCSDAYYRPDLWLCSSLLDLQWADRISFPSCRQKFISIPIDVDRIKWRKREQAKVFVHNAGHGGLKGRNGSAEFFAALNCVKSPVEVILRSQHDISIERGPLSGGGFLHVEGPKPYEQLFETGDVFVFPEKFNGLSLPLQEAFAAGMLVMGTNRFPMNTWLPNEPLIPTAETRRNRIGPAYCEFDEAIVRSEDVAAKIDEWYGRDISDYSERGRAWAEANSWEKLGPKYLQLIEDVCLSNRA